MCRRGEIYNVDFGNNENSYKQCGVRPALVVSNNRANENSPVVTVVPLTARVWKKKYLPTHVQIPLKASVGLSKPSMALAEQVETLDKNNYWRSWERFTMRWLCNRLRLPFRYR